MTGHAPRRHSPSQPHQKNDKSLTSQPRYVNRCKMSGFEVVGVVLGVIPLLVSAIEKYKTTSHLMRYFKYKEPFVAQLIQSLEDQKFFIESDLYIPLRATHLDDDRISELLGQPSSNIFNDLEIVDAIRGYLGDGYLPYQRAVTRCYQALAQIASSIGGLASPSPVRMT